MSSSMTLESKYCAHNYQPLPVVLTRREGVFAWDNAGKKYWAVSQVRDFLEEMDKLRLAS